MEKVGVGKLFLQELQIFFALLLGEQLSILGLQQSQGMDSIIPLILNFISGVAFFVAKFKDYNQVNVFWKLKLLIILIQVSMNVETSQFCLIMTHLLEDELLKCFCLGTALLINIIQDQETNYITTIPNSILLFFNIVIWFGFLFMKCTNTKREDVYLEKELKQKSTQLKESINNRDIGSRVNQQQSMLQELNPLKIESNEDEQILQHVAWIQNQSVLVYNNKLNIVYQNIFLGKLLKQSTLDELQTQQQSKPDYEEQFLSSQILLGSKELIEINNVVDQSLNSDGSFLLNRVNDYHKCRLKSKLTIRDLTLMMQNEFDKWRTCMVTLFALKSEMLDFENVQVKAFVNKINENSYVFFLFDQKPVQKKSDESNLPIINVITTFVHESVSYINCILTLILLTQSDHENTLKISLKQNYYTPIKLISQRFFLFVNSMRDYIFYIQNQLFLKISAFRVSDIVEEIVNLYEDNLKIRDVNLITSIDLSDNNQVLFSDIDRVHYNVQKQLKQILACLLTYCLKYTSGSSLKLDIKSYTVSGIMISFKDSMIAKDESLRKSISALIKTLNSSLKTSSFYQVDLNNLLELQICVILCFQLSGTFKRGIDFLYDSQGCGTFTFVVESQSSSQRMQSHQDTGPIKIIGQRKYYETSLSLMLAQDSSGYREESKYNICIIRYYTLSQLSKQFSMKPGEGLDAHSAYFSQISRIKQDSSNSRQVQNSGSVPKQSKEQTISYSGTWKQGFPDIVQQTYKKSRNERSESQQDSHSAYEGLEQSIPSIHPPEFTPKLLPSVIKYRLRLTCCSKVLIVDNDHYSVLSLQKVLEKYNIKCDRAFNGVEAQQMISNKQIKPCHCGNRSYLLFFIEFHLPLLSGIELMKFLKSQMKMGLIDKGFAIIISTFADLNLKLECFKNGADYFIAKPFDLIDIGAAVQYLDF
ncbi:unnamed protein product (macronuclear) [Paramecium tetraurelia]|uniref:Response regulatory domain-containing protein n=1 Tax=Paramecium tetraurelia TaxID=5888 RepID=A0EF82_PARTE|nr:uncharacterized protein GSPATT00026296001 [Paramecium tetraurelia]CAK93973.1 unnamed protein product [Paramecium tetraurelia]|eukprot:XP_001461346.1 hypothetical protein (macronuclear) [Paramecium tetraurelia strain d4-2]